MYQKPSLNGRQNNVPAVGPHRAFNSNHKAGFAEPKTHHDGEPNPRSRAANLARSGNRPNSKVNPKPYTNNFGNANRAAKMVTENHDDQDNFLFSQIDEHGGPEKYMLEQEIDKLTQQLAQMKKVSFSTIPTDDIC